MMDLDEFESRMGAAVSRIRLLNLRVRMHPEELAPLRPQIQRIRRTLREMLEEEPTDQAMSMLENQLAATLSNLTTTHTTIH